MKHMILRTKEDILDFLDGIIKSIPILEGHLNASFEKKINKITELKSIVSKNNFPAFSSDSAVEWYYKIEVTGRALYLNLMTTKEPYSKFNLIVLTGEILTIDEFANMHNITSVVVRKHIMAGRLPYAYKAGTNWLIPSFSIPIKEKDLNGWFVINQQPKEPSINGIPVKVGDCFTIQVLKRDENNRRRYKITHTTHCNKNRQHEDTYIWGIDEKKNLLNFLIKDPGIDYHSNDIGIGMWLYQ